MITIIDALHSLRPGSQWAMQDYLYSTLVWLDPNTTMPTEAELDAEVQRLTDLQPYEDCKATAKTKIAASDWSVLPDVGLANVADFEAYRATLRALIINPVADAVWPTEPEPVWA